MKTHILFLVTAFIIVSCNKNEEGISAINVPDSFNTTQIDTGVFSQKLENFLNASLPGPLIQQKQETYCGFTCGTTDIMNQWIDSLQKIDLSSWFKNEDYLIKFPDSLFKKPDTLEKKNNIDSTVLLPILPTVQVSDTTGDAM